MLLLLIGCAILILLIVTVTAIYCFRNFQRKRYTDFVLKNSVGLKELLQINARYDFYPYLSFDQTHIYVNENFFDNVLCQDYLIYQLQYIRQALFAQINKVKANKTKYPKYLEEIQSVSHGIFDSPIGKLNYDKLVKTEQKSMSTVTFTPCTEFCLKVTLYCSTIYGRIYRMKKQYFSVEDIIALNKRLNDKKGYFYNDREIWDALCRVERAKVSNQMRFAIYKRDGNRCRKCGISRNYAQLEIDHIVPVSKGGKSTYDNLQTLCHKCNLEKGNTTKKY